MIRLSYLSLFWLLSSSVSAIDESALQPFVAGSFTFLRTANEHSYNSQILAKALTKHGYKLEVKYYPGRRLMAQLNSGVIDADMGRIFDMSKRFDNIVRVDAPLEQYCVQLYQLKNHPLADLNHDLSVRIGTYGGAPEGAQALLARWPNASLVYYDNIKQATQLLSHKRIDLLTISTQQALRLKQHSERPLIIADVFALPATYIHLHKRHKQLALDLAKEIKQLKHLYPLPTCSLSTNAELPSL